MSSMFENPSADKFGPPPENARRERELERRPPRFGTPKEWLVVALAVAYLGMKVAFRPKGGWALLIVVLLGAVLLVAQFVVGRQVRDERGGTEPYSPWNRITR